MLQLFWQMTTGLEPIEYLEVSKTSEAQQAPSNTLDKIIDISHFNYSTIESLDLSELKQIELLLENISPSKPLEWAQSCVEDLLQLICQNNPDLSLKEAVIHSEKITKLQADKLLKSINLAIENKTTQTLTEQSSEFKQTALEIQDLWELSTKGLQIPQKQALALEIMTYLKINKNQILKFRSTTYPAFCESFLIFLNKHFHNF